MMCWRRGMLMVGVAGLVAASTVYFQLGNCSAQVSDKAETVQQDLEWQLPNEKVKLAFKDEVPIIYVTRGQNLKEWNNLPVFWNDASETVTDPTTGKAITRRVVKIKVPLGLNQAPPVPVENPMTLQRWALGRDLYFDTALSADGKVSCATCHDPKRGFTDQSQVSTGIGGNKGGVSAPTVYNTAYNLFQFWDGRGASLEDQAQGPVQNSLEMFDGKGHAWNESVKRIRKKGDYARRFLEAFGTEPTRDTIAKAIATYERTVLKANSIYDRADLAARKRVSDEGGSDFAPRAEDFGLVLKQAVKAKDTTSLDAVGLKDESKIADLAASLASGRTLFFNKARCGSCHVGENFTDNGFHNLGVGVKDGKLPADSLGRFAQLPTGHKNPDMVGAFKTPTLRGLAATGPYLHDGSEKTLEAVIDFYDRGGNANEYLSTKMRDPDAEKAYAQARATGTAYKGPKAFVFGPSQKVIVPLPLNLTQQEKADLVLFLRALEGDPIDPLVADVSKRLPTVSAGK